MGPFAADSLRAMDSCCINTEWRKHLLSLYDNIFCDAGEFGLKAMTQ